MGFYEKLTTSTYKPYGSATQGGTTTTDTSTTDTSTTDTGTQQTQTQPVQQKPVTQVDTYQPTSSVDALEHYNQTHAVPQRQQVVIPKYHNQYADYSSMLAALDPEDTTKKMKSLRAKENIAAISDGVSAIANIIGTSQGGLNVFDPKTSLSAAVQAKYDKLLAQQKADREQYFKIRKAQADAKDKELKANQDVALAKQKSADSDYRAQLANNAAGAKNYSTAVGNDRTYNFNVQKEKNDQANFDRDMKYKYDELAQRKWHDRQTVALGWANNSKDNKPDTFAGSMGTFTAKRTPTNNSINSMLAELEGGGYVEQGNYMQIKKGLMSLGDVMYKALSQTDPAKKRAVTRIMNKYGYRQR